MVINSLNNNLIYDLIHEKPYNTTIKVLGNCVKITQYKNPINNRYSKIEYKAKNEVKSSILDEKSINNNIVKINSNLGENEPQNRSKIRAINEVFELVQCNYCMHTKFITLTYKITELDLEKALKNKDEFIRKLTKYVNKKLNKKINKIKYVCVVEYQHLRGKKEGNKGSIHFHIILFTPFKLFNGAEGFKEMKSYCWPYGSIDIKSVQKRDNPSIAFAFGKYLCKYITKDFNQHEKNKPYYYCSKDLIRPIDLTSNDIEIESLRSNEKLKPINIFKCDYEFTTQKGVKYSNSKTEITYNYFGSKADLTRLIVSSINKKSFTLSQETSHFINASFFAEVMKENKNSML